MPAPKEYKHFNTFFSPKEWKIICKRAEKCNRTPGKFIKEIALNGELKIYNMKDVIDLTTAINRVGNNINQIVKLDNQTRDISNQDILNLQKQIDYIKSDIGWYTKGFDYESLV